MRAPNADRRRAMVGLLGLVLMISAAAAVADEPTPAWDEGKAPLSIVTNGWVDVREILRSVAENAGMGLQLAPDVNGKINVHLEGVRLGRALDAVLDPVDLGYEVVDNVLVVYRRGMVTRWLTFDYPVTERVGRGELQVSASGEDSGDSGGGGGQSNSNESHVTSTATMTVWPGVMESLKTLVFQGADDDLEASQDEQQLALNMSDGEGRCLVVNPMASLVQVTAEWDRVRQVEQLLERLKESLQRQVAIEVRIMEVILDKDLQTGVNWDIVTDGETQSGLSTFSGSDNIGTEFFQFVVDSKHINGVLQAVASSGDLRTLSSPRITTLNNQKAVVRVVTEDIYYEATVEPALISNGVGTEAVVNYTPRSVSVGVVLDVTPQVGRDRVVTLNVHPTISDVVGVARSPNEDTAPILSIRELDTVGKVRDGDTLVIAGLISDRRNVVRTGVPLLKDIPLLGALFSKTSNTKTNIELVMLLTPVIMNDAASNEIADAERARMEARMDGR